LVDRKDSKQAQIVDFSQNLVDFSRSEQSLSLNDNIILYNNFSREKYNNVNDETSAAAQEKTTTQADDKTTTESSSKTTTQADGKTTAQADNKTAAQADGDDTHVRLLWQRPHTDEECKAEATSLSNFLDGRRAFHNSDTPSHR
jgi:hypothetical protein